MSDDPKKVAGDQKDPLHLLPTEPLRKLARVLQLGAKKYGVYNWRESDGVKASTYSAAMMRHLLQFMDGEYVDEESGESHLAHIMATCAILLDAESVGNLIDDRAKPSPSRGRVGPDMRMQQTCKNSTCAEMHDGFCTHEAANRLRNCTGRKP